MIIKLASAISEAPGFTAKAIDYLRLGNLSKRLASDPHLVDKVKNASLVGTIALGDAALRVHNRKPGESKTKAFAHGAAEGAFAGSLIAGADHLIDTLRNVGERNLKV